MLPNVIQTVNLISVRIESLKMRQILTMTAIAGTKGSPGVLKTRAFLWNQNNYLYQLMEMYANHCRERGPSGQKRSPIGPLCTIVLPSHGVTRRNFHSTLKAVRPSAAPSSGKATNYRLKKVHPKTTRQRFTTTLSKKLSCSDLSRDIDLGGGGATAGKTRIFTRFLNQNF